MRVIFFCSRQVTPASRFFYNRASQERTSGEESIVLFSFQFHRIQQILHQDLKSRHDTSQQFQTCPRVLTWAVPRQPNQELVRAQEPMSSFFAGAEGEISKSKISIGRPIVVQALGISTIPAMWPCTGAQDNKR